MFCDETLMEKKILSEDHASYRPFFFLAMDYYICLIRGLCSCNLICLSLDPASSRGYDVRGGAWAVATSVSDRRKQLYQQGTSHFGHWTTRHSTWFLVQSKIPRKFFLADTAHERSDCRPFGLHTIGLTVKDGRSDRRLRSVRSPS